ncbi:MAG: EAL domain-containing protein [Solirubrobacteraceae bacterium]
MAASDHEIARLLLRALDENAAVGFAFIDPQLRFVRVNPALATAQGVPAEEHEGRLVSDLAAGVWPQLREPLERALSSGRPVLSHEIAGPHPLRDQEWGTWQASFFPAVEDGRASGVACLAVETTDRTREAEVRSAITDAMVEGLLVLDAGGAVTHLNAAAAQLTGWPAEELLGRRYAEHETAIADALADGLTRRAVEGRFAHHDGTEIPVGYSAAPLVSGDSVRGVVVVFRDISAEQERRAAQVRELDDIVWLARVRSALDDDRLVLHTQPIVPLDGGAPREELLVRMLSPAGELIPPGAFLPAAEEYGLITRVDRWVIRQAARLAGEGRHVEINLSAKSATDPTLFSYIEQELQAESASPACLTFELTETALMGDWEVGTAFARRLTELGCALALDDFGTGFGSLSYLKALPLRCLKIDVDFVRDLASNPTNQHLVRAIVNLAGGLGLETIAEGVEDAETLELLRAYGVDYAQGFHLGRPAPLIMPAWTSPLNEGSTS